VCTKADASIDEFVQMNGPGRNFGMRVWADMSGQLQDFYGDTGTGFRAPGFNNRVRPTTSGIAPGFSIAVDDMVISWRKRDWTRTRTTARAAASAVSSTTVSYDGSSI
jgi:hypothetical protein